MLERRNLNGNQETRPQRDQEDCKKDCQEKEIALFHQSKTKRFGNVLPGLLVCKN
jgi:hypothetical protein